ncbi:hypothetical protein [Herbaspirillum rubrisubalbicans]|uniref:hypothetical protein n=1 Tax=Herbaspirillum rubrisubalbicans TaxID=80842 RepID=UPI0015C53A3F|nr:hypothetical protein [Herbaspirillum rubrisubalbicans]NQE51856.1 hypothetical protein [Herbaspirillum rubrisubalbicans]
MTADNSPELVQSIARFEVKAFESFCLKSVHQMSIQSKLLEWGASATDAASLLQAALDSGQLVMDNMGAVSKPINQIVLFLARWVAGETVGDEALYRLQQFGFIYPDSQGQQRLTPAGKKALQDNGLA